MKLTALLPLLLVFAFATPAAAQDKSYAEVRYLYEKAILAAQETRDDSRDAYYAELSWELLDFDDLDLLARIPPKMTNDISLAIVDANLALAHARAGDCSAALQRADRAFSESLVERLTSPRLADRAWTALNSIVRTFVRCGEIERIEQAIADDERGGRVIKRYLARADSIIASSLYLAGDLAQAERYLAKAKARALAIEEELGRSLALSQIVHHQILTGRLEDALETANAITVTTDRRPIGPTAGGGGYQGVKNKLLETIAFRFGLLGAWDRAFAALDSRTVHARYFPESFVFLRLEHAKSHAKAHKTENAGTRLARTQRLLRDHSTNRGLRLLATAIADLGEESQAAQLLDDLYEEELIAYREEQADEPDNTMGLYYTLDRILRAYVLIGRPQDALDKLTSEPLAEVKADNLLGSWGALFGYAILHDDVALSDRVEPVLENATRRNLLHRRVFSYLLDRRAFAEAEDFIERMEETLRHEAYSRLAREQLGISYWENIYNRHGHGT